MICLFTAGFPAAPSACGEWGLLPTAGLRRGCDGPSGFRARAAGVRASAGAARRLVQRWLSRCGSRPSCSGACGISLDQDQTRVSRCGSRLSCSGACGISWTRDQTRVRCTGSQVLTKRTNRGIPTVNNLRVLE